MANKLIIVGSAQSLLKSKNGKKIDKFDYVVRCNEFVLNGFEEDVGTKVDAIAVPANCILERIIKSKGRTENETYIKNVSTVLYCRKKGWVEKSIRSEKIMKSSTIDKFFQVTNEDFDKFHKLYGYNHWPSTGLVAILLCIEHFKDYEITITGFDGFETKHYYADQETPGKNHSTKHEQKLLSKLIKENNIKVLV